MMAGTTPYFSQSRLEMLPFLPANAKLILEVGCGAGSFGSALRQRYPKGQIFGIEINPQAAKEARAIYSHVWVGDAGDVLRHEVQEVFDLIIFNDILEHLADPWACLRSSQQCIAANGRVVASIPNMRFWPILSDLVFHCSWAYREAGVMDRTHLRFFTEKSMRDLFADSGYEVLVARGINKTSRKSKWWRVLNILSAGRFEDCLFPQFAIVAKPNRDEA